MLHSTCLPSGRRLTVYTPPGYDADEPERYPLLVLHDAQNLFEPDRAYVQGEHWRVSETADALIADGRIEPLVIAGVDHAYERRVTEFTPTPGDRLDTGEARVYVDLIVDEALPFLRANYAVRVDAASTGLGGSSLGGLVTLFAAATRPSIFGRLLVMSPSVWWDDRVILDVLAKQPIAAETRMWLDVGLKEERSTIEDARRLHETLAQTAAPGTLHYFEDHDGGHSERAWAWRFSDALVFLYPPTASLR